MSRLIDAIDRSVPFHRWCGTRHHRNMKCPDHCMTCEEPCSGGAWLCKCCKKRWRGTEPLCKCPEGPVLGKRTNWAKPRCGRCRLFISQFDQEVAKAYG